MIYIEQEEKVNKEEEQEEKNKENEEEDKKEEENDIAGLPKSVSVNYLFVTMTSTVAL